MIGLIAAMQVELAMLQRETVNERVVEASGLTFTVGSLAGKQVVMTVCGEGKVNAALATEAMILLFSPSFIINTGVAGSLSPTLGVGDMAIACAVCQHDYDISPLGYPKGRVLFPGGHADRFDADGDAVALIARIAAESGVHAETGVVATGDVFVADETVKHALVRDFGAIACEMEGGAIGQVCCLGGVPFAVIRAISDNADDGESFDPVTAARVSVDITKKVLEKM